MQQIRTHEIKLHAAQLAFRQSPALYRGFVGGRGSGKSYAAQLDLALRASKPRYSGRLFLSVSPTYQMLRDSSLRTFEHVAGQLGLIAGDIRRGDNVGCKLINGAEVLFRSADEPERLRGPNISGAALDEASLMQRAVYEIVIACLREGGEAGWLSAAFTPKGKQHWTYEVFGQGMPNTAIFHAASSDNPFLPPDFVENVRRQYTSSMAAQELSGQFIDPEGSLFNRSWFSIIDRCPPLVARVRAWDLAGSVPKDGSDPDFTVGCLLGRTANNQYVIADIRRTRATPQNVEQLVRQTAEEDGHEVTIWMEQEPGSSGLIALDHYRRNVLAGYSFRGERSTGEKATRASPLAAMAEGGNVRLLRGLWNSAFLDEAEAFPGCKHDDQIDAASLAFSKVMVKFASVPDPALLAGLQDQMKSQHQRRREDRIECRGKGGGFGGMLARWNRRHNTNDDDDLSTYSTPHR